MTDTRYTDAATGREWVREDAHNAAIAEARREALREAMVLCNKSYGDGVGAVHRHLAALIETPAPAPAQPSVQEAAKVLLDAYAHTDKRATFAAAKEFPQMGFINAGAVLGAALRALASEEQK